jgi:hypothetical protein
VLVLVVQEHQSVRQDFELSKNSAGEESQMKDFETILFKKVVALML